MEAVVGEQADRLAVGPAKAEDADLRIEAPALVDADNGFLRLEEAARAIQLDSDERAGLAAPDPAVFDEPTALRITAANEPALALLAAAAGPLALPLVFGSRYADAAVPLALLAAGVVVIAANGVVGTALIAAGKLRLLSLQVGVSLAVNLACLGFHVWPYVHDRPEAADELRLDLDTQPGVDFDDVRAAAGELRRLLDELGLVGFPKTTGNRGLHVYVRLEPRWDSYQVRAAAVAAARELERRRPELITAAWWKEERGRRVFVDFNQNAPHKAVFGAWSVRARPGAQVSAPLTWDEVDTLHPDELTIVSVPERLAAAGDPWAAIDEQPQSLEPLLELHERDRAAGLMDAPWPPVYPKQPDEPPRVAPSRARKE